MIILVTAALATSAQAVSSQQAVGFLNAQRAANGLPGDLATDPNLTFGCQKHNYYMDANGLGHGESPDRPRYSEAGAALGPYFYWAEVLSGGSEYTESGANPWEDAPIHLYLMLSPDRTRAGYDANYGFACMRLGGSPTATEPRFYSYPGPGTAHIYSEQYAAESPYTPQELVGIPEGVSTGPNILLFSQGAGDLRAQSYALRGPQGAVESRLVDASTKNSVGDGHWFRGGGVLIPVSPLQPDSAYTASINWVNENGTPYTQAFSFRTRFEPPEPMKPQRAKLKIRRGKKQGRKVVFRIEAAEPLQGRIAKFKIKRLRRECGFVPFGGRLHRHCTWRPAKGKRRRKLTLTGESRLQLKKPANRRGYLIRAKVKPFTDPVTGISYRRSSARRQYKNR